MREIGRPFWLAGGFASPDALKEARDEGAEGIQVGTIFAYSRQSGIRDDIKAAVIEKHFKGELEVVTDFRASPTGFPFKTITLDITVTDPVVGKSRERICDLGYLRNAYATGDGKLGYRCASEPIDAYVQKGGKESDTVGRHCLCNGLMATIGLGQSREGVEEPPIITSGDDFSFLDRLELDATRSYGAEDALDYLTGGNRTDLSLPAVQLQEPEHSRAT
jgi:NAD(P)H-dependent flavin oxidoreductase YrpB (nitropropane dioxygenase family)